MKKINNEKELCGWFENNFKELGYNKIKRRNKRSFPDYIMIKNGKEVKVEIETVLSNFNLHNHNVDGVDDVVCVKENVKLPLNVISLDDKFSFDGSRLQGSWYIKEETIENLKGCKREVQFLEDEDMTQNQFVEFLLEFWENNDERSKEVSVSGKKGQ